MTASNANSDVRRRVVKVGGSLFQSVRLPSRLFAWLERQSPAETFFMVGGGDVVDAVRELDHRYPIDPVVSHWICIDLLAVTFQYAQRMFPPLVTVSTNQQLAEIVETLPDATGRYLVATDAFYNRGLAGELNSHASQLPQDWRTTSDTLAALLGIETHADELVLLKTCDVDEADVSLLAERGVVDHAFEKFARHIPRVRVERLEP